MLMDLNLLKRMRQSNIGINSDLNSFRKSNFAKLNTEELFKSVDADGNGTISEDEWVDFWTSVLRSGHTEEEISEEVYFPQKPIIA